MRIPAIHMTDVQLSDFHLAGLRWPASQLPGRAIALTVSLLRALFIPAIPVGPIALLLSSPTSAMNSLTQRQRWTPRAIGRLLTLTQRCSRPAAASASTFDLQLWRFVSSLKVQRLCSTNRKHIFIHWANVLTK